MSCYYTANNSAADKARAEYAYEFGEQDAAEQEEERRDYKAEALAIAAGESMMLTERGHLLALHEELQAVYADLDYLRRQNEMLRSSHPAFQAVRKPVVAVMKKEEVA